MKTHTLILFILVIVHGALAAPSDFNAIAGYGSNYDNDAGELVPQNITLAGETSEPDGRVRLSFNGSVRNMSIGYFENVHLRFEVPGPDWNVEIVSDLESMPDLAPNGTSALPQPIVLIAPAADAAAVKTRVLAGQRLRVTAVELHQFRLPPVEIDQATETNFIGTGIAQPGRVLLRFSATSTALSQLGAGKLFLENPRGHRVSRGNGPNLPALATMISEGVAAEDWQEGKITTTRMIEVTNKTVLGNGEVQIEGIVFGGDPNQFGPFRNGPAYRGLLDNLSTGTFTGTADDAFDRLPGAEPRDPYFPTLGNSAFSASEDAAREAERLLAMASGPRDGRLRDLNGLFALHLPLNDIEVVRGVKVDGQLALTGLQVKLGVRLRNGQLHRFTSEVTSRAEVNLRVTVQPGTNTANLALFQREKTVAVIPLPKIVIPLGGVPIEVAPVFSAKVGAEVSARGRLVLPVTSSVEAGLHMSWDASRPEGSRFVYRPVSKVVPLAVSKPEILRNSGASASVYAEAALEILLDEIAGPFVGVRATATLGVTPFNNPWWNYDARLDLNGGLRMRVLGFELGDIIENVLPGPELFALDAGTDTPSGAGTLDDPAEGSQVRWGRGLRFNNGTIPQNVLVAKAADASGDVFIAVQNPTNEAPIMRVGPKGQIVRALSPSPTPSQAARFRALAAVPDGGFVVAGNNFISRHGADCAQLWTATFDLRSDSATAQNEDVRSVVVREGAPGVFEFFVCGTRDNNLNTLDRDAFMLRFDDAGARTLEKRFASASSESVGEVILLADGNLLFCGDVKKSPDGTAIPGSGVTNFPWLMKVTPNGDFLWSVASNCSVVSRWNSVTEKPDGTLFTAGTHAHSVIVDYPSLMVGRYSPTGELEELVTVGEAMPGDKANIPASSQVTTPGFLDWLPSSGLTPFDRGTRVRWTGAGLAVVGATGLGANTAPLAMLFSDNLAMRFFDTFEGEGNDYFTDVVATTDGIFAGGYTESFATPGTTERGAFFLKMPFEGGITPGATSGALAKYLQPTVYNLRSSGFTPSIPSGSQGYVGTEALTLTALSQAVVPHITAAGTYTDYTDFTWTTLHTTDLNTPSATTLTPIVSATRTTLRGEAQTANREVVVRFEWGTSATALTNITSEQMMAPAGTAAVPFTEELTGLTPGATYFYRARVDYDGTTLRGGVISFTAGNRAPFTRPDIVLSARRPVIISVLDNDGDPDGDALTLTSVTHGSIGSTAILSGGRTISYASGQPGFDSFTYTVSDGSGGVATGEVFIEISARSSVLQSSIVAETGAALPDVPNGIVTSFGMPAIADDGSFAALVRFRAGNVGGVAIFRQDADGVNSSPIFTGAEAPGIAGARFVTMSDPVISPSGQIAFHARIAGPGITAANDEGVWSDRRGFLERIIVEGGGAPGLPAGLTVRSISSFSLRDAHILAVVRLAGVGVNAANDLALVHTSTSGTVENAGILLRRGQSLNAGGVNTLIARIHAPGFSAGSQGHARTHGDLRSLVKVTLIDRRQAIVEVNSVGDPAVLVAITGRAYPGVGTFTEFGPAAIGEYGNGYVVRGIQGSSSSELLFYSEFGTSFDGIIRRGTAVPNVSGATFTQFQDPIVNADNDVAFVATFKGGTEQGSPTGIFSGPVGALELVQKTGGPVTDSEGLPDGNRTWRRFTQLALPTGGNAGPVFIAEAQGTSDRSPRTGLWAKDSQGITRRLLLTGEALDTVKGSRTVTSFSLLRSSPRVFGTTRSFNVTGGIIALATFSDGTQGIVRFDVP